VADDHAMADELIAWLKRQPFMQAYVQLPTSEAARSLKN